MTPIGLYVHVPFCVRKCAYCDFASYSGRDADLPAYMDALAREAACHAARGVFDEYAVRTAYVGGGTPSLAADRLADFLAAHRMWLFPNAEEITIEANPGTIGLPGLRRLFDAGCNRLSIGLQSLHDRELRTLGRIHSRDDALRCVQAARQAGFRNLCLDLMFGIPGATLADWLATLRETIALAPEHVSAYNLTIEAGTPFAELREQGKLNVPDDGAQVEMYDAAVAELAAAGYEQYEISNFARPGFRSQHNQIYWRNEEYIGLGAAAHSYLRGCRYWNASALDDYLARSRSNAPPSDFPPTVDGHETLDLAGAMGETMMMQLRLRDGVDLRQFQRRFGLSIKAVYGEQIAELCAEGLLEINQTRLRLTMRGVRFANEAAQRFLAPALPNI